MDRKIVRQPNAKGTYTKYVLLRLNPADYSILKNNSDRAGLSVPAFIQRRCCAGVDEISSRKDRMVVVGQINDLVSQIRGIATNLNQLAHWSNAHSEFAKDAPLLAQQLTKDLEPFKALARKIEREG